ncbi:MAG: hypothetical protein Q9198_011106, partial [Flavoplaca austrocitrina]
LSLFISALDTTIVATAIPTISADLHAASGYLWIGGAYILAAAAGAPLWAKLSDIWGRKPILLAAVAWFAGSSILCARAKTIEMLIIGRAFQGTAGGGLIQLVNIVVSDMFSMRLVAVTTQARQSFNNPPGREVFTSDSVNSSGRLLEVLVLFSVVSSRN